MKIQDARGLKAERYNAFEALERKPLAIKQIPFEIRREEFILELIVNFGNGQDIEGNCSDLVWELSEIFLTHFEKSKHLAPNRYELAESYLFSSCINNSDLIAVVKKDGRPLAFGTYDFHLHDNVVFSKATFADGTLERRYGIGNLLNILASFISAEYMWMTNPTALYSVLGRSQHPLQVAFIGRHSDRVLCSTSQGLGAEDREMFQRFAGLCYPSDHYDEETGIACGVYQGPGAPPPPPEVNGFYEKEFACLQKEDALYFIAQWDSRQSPTFQRSATLLNKIFGSDILFLGLFLLTSGNLK